MSPVRYPDPAIQVLDPRFAKYRLGNAAVERLATGFRWAEGPVWFGDGRYLLWSDIPNNRIMRWLEETGEVSVFRSPSQNSNGHTRDKQGRLVTCEHDSRRVTRTEYDGSITVLMDRFQGKPLNAPNDVVVKSDGSIWFTDPGYGIMFNYEGHKAPLELPAVVYRLDPTTHEATVVVADMSKPNGLCFSPDEALLYVVDSGSDAASDSRLRCGGGYSPGEWSTVCRHVAWHIRWHPLRCRRQPVGRRRQWWGWIRRRAYLRAEWRPHRSDPAAGEVRQHLFWGRQAESAVHGGQPVDLCRLCGNARGADAVAAVVAGHPRLPGGPALIHHHPPTLDDQQQAAKLVDVLQRVAGDDDEVGQLARLHRA